jgi:hypothetical protein
LQRNIALFSETERVKIRKKCLVVGIGLLGSTKIETAEATDAIMGSTENGDADNGKNAKKKKKQKMKRTDAGGYRILFLTFGR